jgi:UDP-N-acetylglucosamine 2-epimerase (non-hydrolysing)
MPKEINRLVIDGLSDLLFTAGISSNSNATREGAEMHKIYMVGNILMDSLRQAHDRLRRPAVLDKYGLQGGDYLVFTLNRRALMADTDNLARMLHVITATGIPVIAPLRGQAAKVVTSLSTQSSALHVIHSLDYLEFGWLTAHAKGIVTDSGNVAEEATFNNVPCITLNSYTEHIETVKQGSNVLVGEDAEKLRQALDTLMTGQWKPCSLPDRWDGRTAERIVQTIIDLR